MTPKVSVVIPTHNRRALLARTLRSVLDQRGVSFDIIVIDDGSSDGTYEFLQQCGDPRITVLRHETARGVSAARNTGLAHAPGEWVAFLDDDDLWAPDKLAAQLRASHEHLNVGWVSVGAVTVNDRLQVIAGKVPVAPVKHSDLLASNYIAGGGSGVMVRTDLARSVGGFDLNLANIADWDLWIRLALQAPLATVCRPLVAYMRHSSSLSQDCSDVIREFEWITAKYADIRAQCGLSVHPNTLKWFARRQVQAGNRIAAARLYMRVAWLYGDSASWSRAVLGLMSPGFLSRRWDRHTLKGLPSSWVEEVETWLAPLRGSPALPTGRAGVAGRYRHRFNAGVPED